VAGTDYQSAQSVTGIVKSSGTTRSAAVAGTDYQAPITLTTTGSSGAATFSSSVSMVGNGKISSITPYLELRDTNWAASTFIQTGVNVGATASGDYFNIYNPAGKGLSYVRGGVVDFMISPAGNIGIGTTSPTTFSLAGKHLEVFGGSDFSFIHNNTTTVKSFFATNEASLLTALFTFSNHPLTFGTNNTERMRIKANGVINIASIPTSAAGLSAGDIYSNLGILTIV